MFRDPRHLDPLPHESRVPIRSLLPTGLRSKKSKEWILLLPLPLGYRSVFDNDLFLERSYLHDEGVKIVLRKDGDGVIPATTVLGEVNLNGKRGVSLSRLLWCVEQANLLPVF